MSRFRYDAESDVLLFIVSESGKLSHAEEIGDIVVHLGENGEPLFLEVLNASKKRSSYGASTSEEGSCCIGYLSLGASNGRQELSLPSQSDSAFYLGLESAKTSSRNFFGNLWL